MVTLTAFAILMAKQKNNVVEGQEKNGVSNGDALYVSEVDRSRIVARSEGELNSGLLRNLFKLIVFKNYVNFFVCRYSIQSSVY